MADVIITFTIMPESPDVDLAVVEEKAIGLIKEFGGEVGKKEVEPVAFGLKALKLIFIMDESKGATDSLEDQVVELEGVNSCEVTDVRRALG
jgi:elongation factor 1-beta